MSTGTIHEQRPSLINIMTTTVAIQIAAERATQLRAGAAAVIIVFRPTARQEYRSLVLRRKRRWTPDMRRTPCSAGRTSIWHRALPDPSGAQPAALGPPAAVCYQTPVKHKVCGRTLTVGCYCLSVSRCTDNVTRIYIYNRALLVVTPGLHCGVWFLSSVEVKSSFIASLGKREQRSIYSIRQR